MKTARKLAIVLALSAQPAMAGPDSSGQAPRDIDQARAICADLDGPVESRTYIHACMSVYLSYMRGLPADMRAPFAEDLNHLARAQMAYESRMKGFDEYFAVVRARTCKIAEDFRNIPLMSWEMGEVVVGIAEMVQEQASGNRNARIPMEAGEMFKGCKMPQLTS